MAVQAESRAIWLLMLLRRGSTTDTHTAGDGVSIAWRPATSLESTSQRNRHVATQIWTGGCISVWGLERLRGEGLAPPHRNYGAGAHLSCSARNQTHSDADTLCSDA